MCVDAVCSLVSHMRQVDGDTARLFFRRGIDLIVSGLFGTAGLSQYLGDRRC